MELTTVSCNNCGAPLRIPSDARFVTCNHCSTQLAVKHSESVTFTEQLGEINQRTERIEEDLADLKYRQELEDIDRDWERERENYMITGKHGRRRVPSTGGSLIGAVVIVLFGFLWMGIAGQAGAGPFALFGLVFILIGIGTSIVSFNKAQQYTSAQRRYERRRSEAISRRRR